MAQIQVNPSATLINVNGNIIDTTTAEHTYRDASTSNFIYILGHNDLTIEQKKELSWMGVDIQEYISDHTYMCHYKNTDLEVIRQLAYIKTANVYEPVLKMDQFLKRSIEASTGNKERWLEISLHPSASQSSQEVLDEIIRLTGASRQGATALPQRVEIKVDQQKIQQITNIDSVNHIEEFKPSLPSNEYTVKLLALNYDKSQVVTPNSKYEGKWTGAGQKVCVADTGCDPFHEAFQDGRIKKYDHLWMNWMTDPGAHGTHVTGTVIQGCSSKCDVIVQGLSQGPNAKGQYLLTTPADVKEIFKRALDDGCLIHTNSWGLGWDDDNAALGPRPYDIANSETADEFMYYNSTFIILAAGGNDGQAGGYKGEIQGRANAKNVITVGNCTTARPNQREHYDPNYQSNEPQDARDISWSSSTGYVKSSSNLPGRIKPDVVAPGSLILSCASSQMPYRDRIQNANEYGTWGNDQYIFMSGTSMATPGVASCCAVIREALMAPWPDGWRIEAPTSQVVKAVLINGTVDLAGHTTGDGSTLIETAPDRHQGFGRVDLSNSLMNIEPGRSCAGVRDAWGTWAISNFDDAGKSPSFHMDLDMTGFNTIRVTLVWADPPGGQTQNKLNLCVESNGKHRHGNIKSNVDSHVEFDQVNNVEKVVWKNPPSTSLKVNIYHAFTKPYTWQNYGLVWMATNE